MANAVGKDVVALSSALFEYTGAISVEATAFVKAFRKYQASSLAAEVHRMAVAPMPLDEVEGHGSLAATTGQVRATSALIRAKFKEGSQIQRVHRRRMATAEADLSSKRAAVTEAVRGAAVADNEAHRKKLEAMEARINLLRADMAHMAASRQSPLAPARAPPARVSLSPTSAAGRSTSAPAGEPEAARAATSEEQGADAAPEGDDAGGQPEQASTGQVVASAADESGESEEGGAQATAEDDAAGE